MAFNILVLHGPNLNLLGQREKALYGVQSLAEIDNSLKQIAADNDIILECYQSNAEHELVAAIHQAFRKKVDFILFNPAGLTHTSIVLRDALLAVAIPFIEVHLSNIAARESFRQQSYFSDIANGLISGLGPIGYELALMGACRFLKQKELSYGYSQS